jgi:hypothetical protein
MSKQIEPYWMDKNNVENTDIKKVADRGESNSTDLLCPDSCSSLLCCLPPQIHCVKCSHALWFGEVYVNGIRWNFEFSPMFGPTFIRLDGAPKANQPKEKNPVWDEFKKWYDAKFKA